MQRDPIFDCLAKNQGKIENCDLCHAKHARLSFRIFNKYFYVISETQFNEYSIIPITHDRVNFDIFKAMIVAMFLILNSFSDWSSQLFLHKITREI